MSDSDDKPKIYLFLSVDVINSTRMKYKSTNPNFNWLNEISNFYDEFPQELRTSIEDLKKTYQLQNKNNAEIWKYAGDEILFYCQITEKDQIPEIIDAFSRVLVMAAEDEKKLVDLKGTAWVGQVPFLDIEFTRENKKDFIGTSIDCGFRLGKYSTKYELIISMEIAKLCCNCSKFNQKIIFLGRDNLKGVLGEFKYPILAIMLNIQRHEKKLFKSCNDDISEYIDLIIQEDKDLEQFKDEITFIDNDIKMYLKSKEKISAEKAKSYKSLKLFNGEIKDDVKTTKGNSDLYENLLKEFSKIGN